MSVFLMGAYDPASQKFCTVTKCGNGFDDRTILRLQKQLKVVKISKVSLLSLIHYNYTQHLRLNKKSERFYSSRN